MCVRSLQFDLYTVQHGGNVPLQRAHFQKHTVFSAEGVSHSVEILHGRNNVFLEKSSLSPEIIRRRCSVYFEKSCTFSLKKSYSTYILTILTTL